MPSITNYATLVQALQDFPHRASIAPYMDYFIGAGHERIASDIFVNNDGIGVKEQQATFSFPIEPDTGLITVPSDFNQWREVRAVVSGANDDLVVKEAAWIYENYPQQSGQGPPSYIAEDTVATATFLGSVSGTTLTVSVLVSGTILNGPVSGTGMLPNTIITGQLTGNTGSIGTYSLNNSQTLPSTTLVSGGDVFIFGPFPDDDYQVVGTYFGTAPVLSAAAPINWIVSTIPYTLLAASMIELCYFLKDAEQLQQWKATYTEKLTAFCQADKAKRFAAMGGAVAPDTAPIW